MKSFYIYIYLMSLIGIVFVSWRGHYTTRLKNSDTHDKIREKSNNCLNSLSSTSRALSLVHPVLVFFAISPLEALPHPSFRPRKMSSLLPSLGFLCHLLSFPPRKRRKQALPRLIPFPFILFSESAPAQRGLPLAAMGSASPRSHGLLFSLLLLLLLSFVVHQRSVRGSDELRALMELKVSLDPENRLLTSWTSEGEPCRGDFEGVACDESGKVANISLQGRGLSGSIAPVVAELEGLTGLYLHFNKISGVIPREIGNLSRLSDLYLNVNNLSGSIPEEIGNMGGLQGESNVAN